MMTPSTRFPARHFIVAALIVGTLVEKSLSQDDGDDDGDDGDGAVTPPVPGFFQMGGNGNAVLSALVSSFTDTFGAVNKELNGTNTPSIPSYLISQAMDAVKFFVTVQGEVASLQSVPAQPFPRPHQPQKVPGASPMKHRPPLVNYEDLDYPDDDVTQPPQPVLKPLSSLTGNGGDRHSSSSNNEYTPPPSSVHNPFLQNLDLIENIKPQPSGSSTQQPQKMSLWEIYKSFGTGTQDRGTLTDFQLAHPQAFSNELVNSIAMSISSIRGQQLPGPETAPAETIAYNQLHFTSKPTLLFNKPKNNPKLSLQTPSALVQNEPAQSSQNSAGRPQLTPAQQELLRQFQNLLLSHSAT